VLSAWRYQTGLQMEANEYAKIAQRYVLAHSKGQSPGAWDPRGGGV